MTRNSTKSLFVLASMLTVTGFAIAAQSGTASARSILNCEGGGRQSLTECCEVEVLKKGLPLWMRQTGRNCSTARMRCVSSPNDPASTASPVRKRCVYVAEYEDSDSKKRREPKSPNRDPAGKPNN